MTIYQRIPDLITAALDDDLVMLDIEKGKYFSLNPVAGSIWDLLETPRSEAELIAALMEEYEVESEQCTSETQLFLAEMLKLGLIKTA